MKTVNISNLKAQLSAHSQLVREGEEVLVCDRNKPVARIVPCRLEGHPVQEQRLIARGVLTPPLKKRPARVSWPEPPGNVSDEVMEQLWREERESRRSADLRLWGLRPFLRKNHKSQRQGAALGFGSVHLRKNRRPQNRGSAPHLTGDPADSAVF